MKVVDAPNLAEAEASYAISAQGIIDYKWVTEAACLLACLGNCVRLLLLIHVALRAPGRPSCHSPRAPPHQGLTRWGCGGGGPSAVASTFLAACGRGSRGVSAAARGDQGDQGVRRFHRLAPLLHFPPGSCTHHTLRMAPQATTFQPHSDGHTLPAPDVHAPPQSQ